MRGAVPPVPRAGLSRRASCSAQVPGCGWGMSLPAHFPAPQIKGAPSGLGSWGLSGVWPPLLPQRPMQALAVGDALPLPRPGWLSSPTLGRANRFLSTAAVSLMTPRRPLSTSERVKVRTLSAEQRTREDSRCPAAALRYSPGPSAPPPPVLQPGNVSRAWEVHREGGQSMLQKYVPERGTSARPPRALPVASPWA